MGNSSMGSKWSLEEKVEESILNNKMTQITDFMLAIQGKKEGNVLFNDALNTFSIL